MGILGTASCLTPAGAVLCMRLRGPHPISRAAGDIAVPVSMGTVSAPRESIAPGPMTHLSRPRQGHTGLGEWSGFATPSRLVPEGISIPIPHVLCLAFSPFL